MYERPVPFDNLSGMARVRREANAMGLPIMADESVLDHASPINVIKADAADIIKVKVMKQGGFLNTRRMIATAECVGPLKTSDDIVTQKIDMASGSMVVPADWVQA